MNEENATVVISVSLQEAEYRVPADEKEEEQPESQNPDTEPSTVDSEKYTSETDAIPCRICLSNESTPQAMISPCMCKGSIANVHRTCLEKWLSQKGNNRCDLCLFEFDVYSTLKYTMLQSMLIWIKHPRNRAFFFYDSAVFLILNILTCFVVSMFIQNLNTVVKMKIADYGITMWFLASGVGAVMFWLIVYCLAVSLFVNAQVRPWYRWWKASRSIRLVINAWILYSLTCNEIHPPNKIEKIKPQKLIELQKNDLNCGKKTDSRKYSFQLFLVRLNSDNSWIYGRKCVRKTCSVSSTNRQTGKK